ARGRYGHAMAAGVRPGSAERLPDDESLFRSLFDADILGVVVADQGRVVEANDAFLRIVGATRAELLAGRLTWTSAPPAGQARAGQWEIEHVRRDGSRVPLPEAMRSGRPVLLGSREAWRRRFPALLPRGDFEAFAAVPLIGERGAVGCMGFGFSDERAFDAGDVELLQVIARQGAQALDRATLYEQRAHAARTLQRGLLPSELPDVPGLQIAAAYEPLGAGDEVGGDFYDVFATDAGWTAAIGDVCGKGVEAAVVTGMVRHTLRALELGHGEPAAVLRRLNQAVRRHEPESRFCSVALSYLTALM